LTSYNGSLKDNRGESFQSNIKKNGGGEYSVNTETERSSLKETNLFGMTRNLISASGTATMLGKKESIGGIDEKRTKIDGKTSAIDTVNKERGTN
jgi:hypothetical protein